MTSAPINRSNYSILFDYAILASSTINFGSNSSVYNGYYGANFGYTPASGPTNTGGTISGENSELIPII